MMINYTIQIRIKSVQIRSNLWFEELASISWSEHFQMMYFDREVAIIFVSMVSFFVRPLISLSSHHNMYSLGLRFSPDAAAPASHPLILL